MPILQKGLLQIDYTDNGPEIGQQNGSNPAHHETIILIHSSASSNRQWRSFTEALQDRYRVLAINLFGYGETTPWPQNTSQTLYAQAQLVLALCEKVCEEVCDNDSPIHLVGHSFGGSVALKAALLLGSRVEKLILLEPNPFFLLRQAGQTEAYLESHALREHVKCYGALGDWPNVAQRFADYWLGLGAWQAMPEERQNAFIKAVPPVFSEWDCMDEETPIEAWANISAKTLVVAAHETQRPIHEIVNLLRDACPQWSFRSVSKGGHMAPLTHPALVNPIVTDFLEPTQRDIIHDTDTHLRATRN